MSRYPDNFPFSIQVMDLDKYLDEGPVDNGCEVQFATFQGRGFEFHKVDVISFGRMPEEVFVWAPLGQEEKVKATVAFLNPHLSILFFDKEDSGVSGYIKLIADIKYS